MFLQAMAFPFSKQAYFAGFAAYKKHRRL